MFINHIVLYNQQTVIGEPYMKFGLICSINYKKSLFTK